MQIEPFGDLVIIKLEYKDKVTRSGLITMQGQDEYPAIGEVVKCGKGVKYDLIGAKVYFRSFKFEEIEPMATKEEKYIIGKEEDILGEVHD